jgi:hypothetical protein
MAATNTLKAPTYTDVENMLNAALLDVNTRYNHLPQLRDELVEQYRGGLRACHNRERDANQILWIRLHGERRVFDAYNKHRLGCVGNRDHQNLPVPSDAEGRLEAIGEDIDEDLESFPFRLEVVLGGFPELTETLLPIHQFSEDKKVGSQNQRKSATKTPIKNAPGGTQEYRSRGTYGKLSDAPPPNLDFPVGNMTLAEMAAFLPQSIKSWDVIDRFCGNGGVQSIYAAMIKHFRTIESGGSITTNTVYRMLKEAMIKRSKVESQYASWTAGTHQQFHDRTSFDASSVSVTGFRTPMAGQADKPADPIPMKDLANGVKIFPTGDDALDLTRAVRYCQEHPDEVWMYPTDYERLVQQLPLDTDSNEHNVGPAAVLPGHHDSAVIGRYTTKRITSGVRNMYGRKRDPRGRILQMEATNTDDAEDEHDETPSRKQAKHSPGTLPYFRTSDSDSDDDDYQGLKKSKQATESRRSTRATKDTNDHVDDESALLDPDLLSAGGLGMGSKLEEDE